MKTENELLNTILQTAEMVRARDEDNEYDLDFSEGSIARLEEMIDDFWGEDGPSKENFDLMVWAFGCYVAAVIETNFNGEWHKEESGELSFVSDSGEVGLKPFNWIAKKFELQDSLEAKYDFATNMIKADRRGP